MSVIGAVAMLATVVAATTVVASLFASLTSFASTETSMVEAAIVAVATSSTKGEGHHPETTIKAMITFCSSHSSIQTSSSFTPIHQIQHLMMEPVPMKSVNKRIKTKHSFEKMADNHSPNQKGKENNVIESVGNYSHDFDTKKVKIWNHNIR